MSITGWKADLSDDILVVYNVGVLNDGGTSHYPSVVESISNSTPY